MARCGIDRELGTFSAVAQDDDESAVPRPGGRPAPWARRPGTRAVGAAALSALLATAAAVIALRGRRRGPWRHQLDVPLEAKVQGPATQCGLSEMGVDYAGVPGHHLDHVPSAQACCAMCQGVPQCQAWVWKLETKIFFGNKGQCWLKGGAPAQLRKVPNPGVISGLAGKHTGLWCKGGIPALTSWQQLPTLWSYSAGGSNMVVKVLTYNLFWWNLFNARKGNGGSWKAEVAQPQPFDLMAFQECESIDWIMNHAGLAGQYTTLLGQRPICMAVRRATFAVLAHGEEDVGEDTWTSYHGRRAAQWARLKHTATHKTVLFVNHHGPLGLNSGGACGGAATAYRLLSVIKAHGRPGDAVILAGDFNANAASQTIQLLARRLSKAVAGKKAGGVDNVFSNGCTVASSVDLGSGGSDHDALSTELSCAR